MSVYRDIWKPDSILILSIGMSVFYIDDVQPFQLEFEPIIQLRF